MRHVLKHILGLAAGLTLLTTLGRADEETAVATIKKAGGTILTDDTNKEKPVVGVIMWGGGYNVGLLKELKELKSLKKVRIGGPWINADGVKTLEDIKTLELLEIRGPGVSDAALKSLGEALPKLKMRRAGPGETPFAAFEKK